jgi:predicted transcriptional regulator
MATNCEKCSNHEAIEREVATMKSNILEIFARLNASERNVDKLEVKMDNVIAVLTELKDKIEELSTKPQKRWDKLVNTIIAAIVTIIIGMAIGKNIM